MKQERPKWNIEAPYFSPEESALLMRPPVEAEQPSAPAWGMLLGLQNLSHVYGGTVPPEEVARRRKANRHARRARRGNTAAIRRQARLDAGRRRQDALELKRLDDLPVLKYLAGVTR